MKRKYNYIIALLVAFSFSIAATAQESTRRFSKSWPVSEVETLEIINKFGEVRISDKGGSQVTIEVLVTVEGSGNRATALLDDITVSFGSMGRKATAETKMASGFKSRGKFSIDYTVSIPESKNLNITNKFGNVVMQDLTGKGNFDIGYGNLTAGQLNTPGSDGFRLNLEYGKADAESMKDARVSLSYSKMFVKSANNVVIESKYSTLNIDNLNTIRVDSKYDTFNFGKLVSLEGESRFTNYRIDTIEKRLKLVTGYGTVRVDHIPADFELIDVNSNYAQISLGIDNNAAYQVYATCDYCSVDYPQNNFSGNRMKENTRQTIDGKIAGGAKGKVNVVSRYGNIKLVK